MQMADSQVPAEKVCLYNTIQYNTIKTICNALKVDRLIESEARAVAGRAEVWALVN